MKERPILFSAPMVRAILDGRKTQTRRVVKAKHLPFLENLVGNFFDGKWNQRPLPYGQRGDRLWVRETWAHVPSTAYRHSEGVQQIEDPTSAGMAAVYREGWERSSPGRWRPSIHMPRWASRIALEIISVRVERLQDITEADAIAEGIDQCEGGAMDYLANDYAQGYSPVVSFRSLWESINGAGSWGANPWVWVVEFHRITKAYEEASRS